jgi:thiol-disulfide isomerase/thioredoxin
MAHTFVVAASASLCLAARLAGAVGAGPDADAAGASALDAAAADASGPGGERPAAGPAPDFLLESTKGERVSLYAERSGRGATAVVFLAETCPVSKLYASKLAKLAREYADQGILFLVVDATAGTDAKRAAAFAKAAGLDVSLLLDPMLAAAARFEVKRTPTSLLVDRDFKVIYRGAIDDQHAPAGSKPHAGEEWLVEAIEAALADAEVETAQTDVAGTELASAAPPPVTFNEHVAPILHRQCADCHRPGQVGPMALLDFDDARGYAPQIAEVIEQGRMPPWHADPRYGRFENERRLTETEKAILERWADGGAREGDPRKKPKPPVFKDDGWAMGKPDLIVELPAPQQIPAEGVVAYRYVLVDPRIEKDVWVQAAEIRPTAQEVTHHVLALYLPPGKSEIEIAAGLRDGRLVGAGYFAVQVPGCRPNLYPEGAGKKIEAGARFVFQLHYTPNGKPAQDRTRLGLKLCKSPPKQEVLTRGVFSFNLRIPPNDPHATATAKWTFRKPARLISMFPHMHMRGAAFRFEKLAGDDEEARTILCDVPKYDFNWQNFYLPAEPVRFAAGDTIFCSAVYDNSKNNPFNPDPNRFVTWGDQSFEEMMIGYIDYVEED